MIGRGHPADLHWADVDPARWPFVPDERLQAAVAVAVRSRDEGVINDAVMSVCGPWAAGWRWARDEGSLGGGVVSAWCCPTHSFVGGDPGIVARVVDAVCEWRAWLVHLRDVFSELGPGPSGPFAESAAPNGGGGGASDDVVARLTRGATQVLAEVAIATSCGDAWYVHAEQVLCWYLEYWGASPSRARGAVSHATSGIFSSWVGVADDVAATAAAAIAARAKGHVHDDGVDALAVYRGFRPRLALPAARARARRQARDGHAAYIDDVDAARAKDSDESRAVRMREALRTCRVLAESGALLDLALLRQLHTIAVPSGGALRGARAFAKRGRERYGFDDAVAAACDDALGDANDVDVDVVARAARAYLDVCFFHPFVDGNARAARLAFDFVLAREGVVVDDVSALFRFPIAATPEACAAYLRLAATVVDAAAPAAAPAR